LTCSSDGRQRRGRDVAGGAGALLPHELTPAGAFVIRFYLSTGDELQSGDVLLSVRNIAGLAPDVSSRAATSVIVPTTTVVPAS
jgi:hypothetical protein